MCSLQMSKEVFNSMREYKKAMVTHSMKSSSTSVGLTVEVKHQGVGTKLPFYSGSGSASQQGSGSVEQFLRTEQGAVAVLEATCLTQEYSFGSVDFPTFRQGFLMTIRNVANNPSDENLKKFIDEYGTHYSKKTTMGAKIQAITKFTKEEKKKMGEKEMQNCASESKSLKFAIGSSDKSSSECKHSATMSSKLKGSSTERTTISSVGAAPSSSVEEWAKTTALAPEPIKADYVPITDLFTPLGFREMQLSADIHNITFHVDRQAILDKLNYAYSQYCTLFPDVDCTEKIGCGISDDCKVTDLCMDRNGTVDCIDMANIIEFCELFDKCGRSSMNYTRVVHVRHASCFFCIHKNSRNIKTAQQKPPYNSTLQPSTIIYVNKVTYCADSRTVKT